MMTSQNSSQGMASPQRNTLLSWSDREGFALCVTYPLLQGNGCTSITYTAIAPIGSIPVAYRPFCAQPVT